MTWKELYKKPMLITFVSPPFNFLLRQKINGTCYETTTAVNIQTYQLELYTGFKQDIGLYIVNYERRILH